MASALIAQQIPRTALFWLIACQVFVILPHLYRLPFWVSIVAVLCFVWRIMIFNGRWSYPSFVVKALLVISAVIAVQWRYHTLIGLDAGTCLLVVAFILKLLEMKQKRDAYVVFFLSYFIIVAGLLYEQTLIVSSYMLLCLLIVIAATVGLNQGGLRELPVQAVRKAFSLLFQAIPLALVLFFLVPRVPPLWSVEPPGGQARTGLSASMAPGDIAQLSQSDELAFRATFTDEVPAQSRLYWRAVVMSFFDGRRWSQTPDNVSQKKSAERLSSVQRNVLSRRALGEATKYQIIQEPTNQKWLFALDMVSAPVTGAVLTQDFRLLLDREVRQRYSYSVESALNYQLESNLPSWIRDINTSLPVQGDPESRQFAQDLYERVGADSERFITALLGYFRQQEFFYTLRPSRLQGDSIDQFLFESRRGFCAHYAGALVFLSRSVGIPARVVAGYQGGEVNRELGLVQVRQFDAHAWAEIWLEGKGWIRVDPTAAVAPDRIEENLQQAVSGEGSFLEGEVFSSFKYQGIPLLNRLRLQLDLLEYYWHVNVLDFDQQRQQGLWRQWLGGTDLMRIVLVMISAIVSMLAVLGLWGWWRQRPKPLDPVVASYLVFCRRMQRLGVPRNPEEGPENYLQRIKNEVPEVAMNAERIIQLFILAQYKPCPQEKRKSIVQSMRRYIRKL